MAFSVQVFGYSRATGEKALELELRWWVPGMLWDDPRFIHSNDTGSYSDYDADLSVEEMRELHERFLPAATSGVFEHPHWQAVLQPKLRRLHDALYERADEFSHFRVNVFEWESGL
jgi:hypothetical protein